ncbi:MAG: TolC family protein, partial [Nitrososphaerales archaeon]
IMIDRNLNPFQLDATSSRKVSLDDVIEIALRSNLNIQISNQDVQINKWKLLNAYSQFLPSPRLGYNYFYAKGHVSIPFLTGGAGSGPLKIDSPFILARAGINYNAFQGGKVLFTALQSRNNLRSTRWRFKGTTNDVLLECARRYYDLILNEVLLQIRIRAVTTSEEQLRLNEDLERDGKATHLDILQARTQLADDKQNLIEQQIARRNAAVSLAEYLNFDQSTDLEPQATTVEIVRLIDECVTPGKLLNAAMSTRPELKSYREQVLAARKGIIVAAAPLYPTVQLSATEFGIGETLSDSKRLVASPVPGAPPTLQSRQIAGLGVLNMNINWTLQGFGSSDYTNIQAARALARQTMLQSNQQANSIVSQVRQSYL